MDFEESDEERAFRAEARAWLSEHAKPRVPGGPSDHSYVPGERTPDADLEHMHACREWQRTLFAAALSRVKRQANARHYQMFDLYAVKSWSVDKVAETLGVSTGQVRLAKHRVTALMRREVARLEKEEEKRWGFTRAMAH